jgi:Sec-independent protein translocase protein TatA
MFDIGPEKLLFIFAAVLLFLGPKEIPAAARTLGKFRQQLRSVQDTLRTELSSVLEVPSSSTSTTKPPAEPASTDVESRSIVEVNDSGFEPGPTSFN